MGILYLVAGSGPGVFLLLMGLYVMYTSWQMHSQIKEGTIYSHPIFKPDCYRRESPPQTNLSRSMPTVRRTPPASPRRSNGAAGRSGPTPKSPKPAGTMSLPMEQPSSPRRDRRPNPGDIEMGTAPPPEKKEKSTSGEKKKKKTPDSNDPTTTASEGTTTVDRTAGDGVTPKKKKSSGNKKSIV